MPDRDREIPEESRALVRQRDMTLCARCNGRGTDWHHRRSRRVRAAHRHCACNGLWLCRTCHSWAHLNPAEARAEGMVVWQWVDEPMSVPHRRFDGWWVAGCDGSLDAVNASSVTTDGMGGVALTG